MYHPTGPNGPQPGGPPPRHPPPHGPPAGPPGAPLGGHPQMRPGVLQAQSRNTIPGDLNGGSVTRISDVSRDLLSEADMKADLTEYAVFLYEKMEDREAFDEYGQLKQPTWDQALLTEDRSVSKEMAAKEIRYLNCKTRSVLDKKNSLPSPLRRQIDSTIGSLMEREPDPVNFHWVIAQISHQLKPIKPPYPDDSARHPEPTRKHRGSSRRLSPKKKSHSGSKKKKHYERLSLTAYFQRVPRQGVDIAQLWREKMRGVEGRRTYQPQAGHVNNLPPMPQQPAQAHFQPQPQPQQQQQQQQQQHGGQGPPPMRMPNPNQNPNPQGPSGPPGPPPPHPNIRPTNPAVHPQHGAGQGRQPIPNMARNGPTHGGGFDSDTSRGSRSSYRSSSTHRGTRTPPSSVSDHRGGGGGGGGHHHNYVRMPDHGPVRVLGHGHRDDRPGDNRKPDGNGPRLLRRSPSPRRGGPPRRPVPPYPSSGSGDGSVASHIEQVREDAFRRGQLAERAQARLVEELARSKAHGGRRGRRRAANAVGGYDDDDEDDDVGLSIPRRFARLSVSDEDNGHDYDYDYDYDYDDDDDDDDSGSYRRRRRHSRGDAGGFDYPRSRHHHHQQQQHGSILDGDPFEKSSAQSSSYVYSSDGRGRGMHDIPERRHRHYRDRDHHHDHGRLSPRWRHVESYH